MSHATLGVEYCTVVGGVGGVGAYYWDQLGEQVLQVYCSSSIGVMMIVPIVDSVLEPSLLPVATPSYRYYHHARSGNGLPQS